jgi:hypothetical protein
MASRLHYEQSMRATRASLLPLLLVTVSLIGCRHRETFEAVDATMQIASSSAANSSYQRQVTEEREEREAIEGRRAYAEAADAAAAKNPKRCTDVRVLIVPPPDPGTPPPRAIDCNGRVLVQDAEGKWRDYDTALAPPPAPAPATP